MFVAVWVRVSPVPRAARAVGDLSSVCVGDGHNSPFLLGRALSLRLHAALLTNPPLATHATPGHEVLASSRHRPPRPEEPERPPRRGLDGENLGLRARQGQLHRSREHRRRRLPQQGPRRTFWRLPPPAPSGRRKSACLPCAGKIQMLELLTHHQQPWYI